MVPSFFVSLAELPFTPNGKVDRKALPAPEEGAPERAFTAPRRASQDVLAGVWGGGVGVGGGGGGEKFFEPGGAPPGGPRPLSPGRAPAAGGLPPRAGV